MSAVAARPKVDVDKTRDRLRRLGLMHPAEQLEGWLSDAVKENVPPHRFLDQMLDAELGVREERRIRTSLKLSGLPPGRARGPGVGRRRVGRTARGRWATSPL